MDELKQINLGDSTEPDIQANNSMEDRVMEPVKKSKFMPLLIVIGILLGIGTGFFIAQKRLLLASNKGPGAAAGNEALTSSTTVKVGDTFGSADEATFRDQAEGILMAGGIDGEGSHHIVRGDNKSQWVYVTSSVVDLDLLVGDRVTVWGETNQGKNGSNSGS